MWIVLIGVMIWVARSPNDQTVLAVPLEMSGVAGKDPALRVGQPVRTGSRLVSSPGEGAMIISLVPGITAQAGNGAEFSLDELTVRKRSTTIEERRAALTIYKGRLRFAVNMPDDRRAALAVTTPLGTVHGQPGSAFSIDVEADIVHVLCAWGALRWEDSRKNIPATMLLAGEFCERQVSASPREDAIRKVLEDGRAQEEMADIFQFGARLNTLEERHRAQISYSLMQSR